MSNPYASNFGLKELAPAGESPTVDMVAMQVLNGHREASFTADYGVLWLRHLLPEAIPDARILTCGYGQYNLYRFISHTGPPARCGHYIPHIRLEMGGGGADEESVFGPATPEQFDTIFQGYHAVLDQPAALFPDELYAAYPDAKFILTTRDPDKWATSTQNTIFAGVELLWQIEPEDRTPLQEFLATWHRDHVLKKFHGQYAFTTPQRIILEHNEKVKRVVPEEKLLVYEVGEGWTRLCQFLEVDAPSVPFPRLNDSESFSNTVLKGLRKGV
ncbi:hypothetical protein BU17DRAFT_90610 [Hysterangium stoloniferum]|nr:hypothetical protein BU17DRAFT_90610 [Hysterangium stoloniferum]